MLNSVYRRMENCTAWEQEIEQVTFDYNPWGDKITVNSFSIEVSGGFLVECLCEYWRTKIPWLGKQEIRMKEKVFKQKKKKTRIGGN